MSIQKMNNAITELNEARYWNDLPNGKNYQSNSMAITTAHSSIELKRMGQQTCGGQSYWKTNPSFNSALLQAIKENPAIIDKALAIMEERVRVATIECKDFHKKLGESIAKAEGE